MTEEREALAKAYAERDGFTWTNERVLMTGRGGSRTRLTFERQADEHIAVHLKAGLALTTAATIARLEAEAEWKPISEYTGCGPALVSTAPDSPKYLASDAVTAFRDVTGVWRCLGSVGGNAELAQQPTHFRAAPERPRLSSRAKDQSQ